MNRNLKAAFVILPIVAIAAGSMQGRQPVERTGMTPLCDMSATDRYKGEDGGLYGKGRNGPAEPLRGAANTALKEIRPLDSEGKPSRDGRVVLVSISMSNATQEFSYFKRIADDDAAKSPSLTIVDCAQGGQAMAEWVDPEGRTWREADRRIASAGISPKQIQVAWIKLANKMPRGDLHEHGRKLQNDTRIVIQNAKARFPNLRIAYLSSRIYGGYATTALNPEPYAYEGAFSVRWLIQEQRNEPVLLWGPYLWADGASPRKSDGLVWNREDLGPDGTHPSQSGRAKVAGMLLTFFKTDLLAKSWFVGH
jgi:hypothetical protein